MPCGHVFGQTGRKFISIRLDRDLNPIIVCDGATFLFVALSRQKKIILCVLCVPAVNIIYQNLAPFASLRENSFLR